jgi:hypothetical protein
MKLNRARTSTTIRMIHRTLTYASLGSCTTSTKKGSGRLRESRYLRCPELVAEDEVPDFVVADRERGLRWSLLLSVLVAATRWRSARAWSSATPAPAWWESSWWFVVMVVVAVVVVVVEVGSVAVVASGR